ncbi:MAG: glycosyltransferase [Alphaproteobacteria bacterium]|uniref:Glycosyltransferase n=1 Tax=Candidatus Nitrobium versatile TaxID=2884831 RepID=A0A953M1I1_9BACT|nr:glycosyltransferase [Candidatus Nitrobium versatile]
MKEVQPKVSIVLPTYNGARYLRHSVESCLAQTYSNIEVIVVDDGSTDATPEIVRSYRDKRMKYIRHGRNRSLPHSLNTGFAAASGEYLTWTSDDNFYYKEAVGKMLAFLGENSGYFVYCDYYVFHGENLFNRKIVRLPDTVSLEKGNHIGPCFLYTREVRNAIGDYDPETKLAEDYDYWIRISKEFPLRHLKEPLYFYRAHEKSLFVSRYYEVKIVDCLVRLKNDLIDIEQGAGLVMDILAHRKRGFYRVNRVLSGVLFSGTVKGILRDFKAGQISLEGAKMQLQGI